ncbi:macro domain-containing protein [Erythrobacter aureus]|uniref:Macro domain-containing protein n=1 Tax=Erythrobacter aureus TaxID=2182384 RepID=A0A345YIZ0_9SPHN|nr:macro domain-containing protein [Erythrobacter aureus]AXK43892.1 hypothetical protein DVR09_15675 [Erythrobacter aureus]
MPFARTAPSAQTSAPAIGGDRQASTRSAAPASRRGKPLRPRFDIRLIADLLASPDGYAAYAGIGSRETPDSILATMTEIAFALEARGFTMRSGFAGGADTAFELGTSRNSLREVFAPWKGFGQNPHSKYDARRFQQIRMFEHERGYRFPPAPQRLITGDLFDRAEAMAKQYHPTWDRLPQGAQKMHTRNMGQVLGPKLDQPARFVIAWTSDGQATGGTGQAIRVADDLGIPVLNLHDADVRAEILRVLGIVMSDTSAPAAANDAGGSVTYVDGDITEDDAELLVNTVNCVGVMGKGVALAFKNRWPSIMPAYQAECRDNVLQAGGCRLFDLPDGRKWAGLATKDHWRQPSQMDWVRTGVAELARQAREAGIRTIAMTAPGCGNGGLDWAQVEPIVLKALAEFDLRLYARTTMGAR